MGVLTYVMIWDCSRKISQRGYIVSHKIMKIVTVGVEKDGTQSGEKYQSGMYVSTSLTSLSS